MKLWPSKKKRKLPSRAPSSGSELPDAIVLYEHKEALSFFTAADLKENVVFTERTIVEFASLESSQDPVFRDGFLYLCRTLSERPHPVTMKLLDYGEENGRLYRAWERRGLSLLSRYTCCGNPGEQARNFLNLLDGFLYLRDIGFSLHGPHIITLSVDGRGCFLGRVPWALHLDPPGPEEVHPLVVVSAWCPDAIKSLRKGEKCGVDSAISFQFQLGTFLWMLLSHQPPFTQAPGFFIASGKAFERRAFDFGPILTPVLIKLTEPDSLDRYLTLDEAIAALKPALRTYIASGPG